jgi:hypothetical protein
MKTADMLLCRYRNAVQNHDVEAANTSFENVAQFIRNVQRNQEGLNVVEHISLWLMLLM